MSSSSAPATAMAGHSRLQWSYHLTALAMVAVLFVALFRFDVSNAVQVWWIYPTYSHCFLILPISAWLVWETRERLALETPSLAPGALIAVPPILLLWLAGDLATINEVRQFAVIAFLEVAILTLLGPRVFRAVLFPALYLFFLVPFGQYLIPPMQDFATWFTDAGLSLLGVPHYTEGTTIELTNGRFEIAEACAGLRFLIATVALGALFARMTYRKWCKAALFLAACIIVPLIGNGFRCLGIIELAHLTNNQLAVGADHLIYGWIFNTAILLVLMLAGMRFRDPGAFVRSSPMPQSGERIFSRSSVLSAALATVVAVGIGPAFAMWHDQRPITVNPETITGRFNLTGWTDKPGGPWRPVYGDADAQLMTSFVPGRLANAKSVDVAIAYYARNRAGRSLIATTNQLWDSAVWHEIQQGTVNVRLGPDPVCLNEAIIGTGARQRLVWWTFWMDGRFTTSSMEIKLLQIKTAFTGNEGAALIAFSIPIDGAVEDARADLETALANLTVLPGRFVAAGRAAGIPSPLVGEVSREGATKGGAGVKGDR